MKNTMRIIAFLLIVVPSFLNAQSADDVVKSASEKIENSKFHEAVKELSAYLNTNEKTKEVLNKRGYAKNQLGDFYGAIGDYNFALELDTTYSEALNNRGEAKFNLGDDFGAIEAVNSHITC